MNYLLDKQETDRLLFRRINRDDFDVWLDFHKSPEASLHWNSPLVSPDVACEKWYQKQEYRNENGLGGHNALIEKDSEMLVGHCGLLVQTVDGIQELEIGYSLLPNFWNKGYATEAAKKCRDFAFENDLADSIISIISITNIPSEKVALKNGMRIEKKTDYKGNEVNIFRIDKVEWKKLIEIRE